MSTFRRADPTTGWDGIPLVNLAAIAIPVALMASWVSVKSILDDHPRDPAAVEAKVVPPDKSLDLRVRITKEGLEVHGATALLAPDGLDPTEPVQLPCPRRGCEAGGYDLEGLSALLWEVKRLQPNHKELTLLPDADIPYAVIVDTLKAAQRCEAAREPIGDGTLFPFVTIKSPYY